jgi:hypothetical protein
MEAMMNKLESGQYSTGRAIIEDNFRTYIDIFAKDPESFRIFMLFQQTGAFFSVNSSVSGAISALARRRYAGMRKIYSLAVDRGLIARVNVFHLVDMIWGTFMGVLQSLDAKHNDRDTHKEFIPNLEFAREIIIRALAPKEDNQ